MADHSRKLLGFTLSRRMIDAEGRKTEDRIEIDSDDGYVWLFDSSTEETHQIDTQAFKVMATWLTLNNLEAKEQLKCHRVSRPNISTE